MQTPPFQHRHMAHFTATRRGSRTPARHVHGEHVNQGRHDEHVEKRQVKHVPNGKHPLVGAQLRDAPHATQMLVNEPANGRLKLATLCVHDVGAPREHPQL
jgi:hypothetical protein